MLKSSLAFFVSTITVAGLTMVIVQAILLIGSDILSGALSGKPETGWGFLIASVLLLPVGGVLLAGAILSIRYYKQVSKKPLWPILVSSLVLAIAAIITITILPGLLQPAENAHDKAVSSNMRSAREKIDDYFYAHRGRLPKQSEIPSLVPSNVKYTELDGNTFQLCAVYETDTIPYKYMEEYPEAQGGIYQKVADNEVLVGADAWGAGGVHRSGIHCYKVALIKPT